MQCSGLELEISVLAVLQGLWVLQGFQAFQSAQGYRRA